MTANPYDMIDSTGDILETDDLIMTDDICCVSGTYSIDDCSTDLITPTGIFETTTFEPTSRRSGRMLRLSRDSDLFSQACQCLSITELERGSDIWMVLDSDPAIFCHLNIDTHLGFAELISIASSADTSGASLITSTLPTIFELLHSLQVPYCFAIPSKPALKLVTKLGFEKTQPVPATLFSQKIIFSSIRPFCACLITPPSCAVVFEPVDVRIGAVPELWRRGKITGRSEDGLLVKVEYAQPPKQYLEILHASSPRLREVSEAPPVSKRPRIKAINETPGMCMKLQAADVPHAFSAGFQLLTEADFIFGTKYQDTLVSVVACKIYPEAALANITLLVTLPDHRNRSFATQALTALINHLSEHTTISCIVSVRDSVSCLARVGFSKVLPMPRLLCESFIPNPDGHKIHALALVPGNSNSAVMTDQPETVSVFVGGSMWRPGAQVAEFHEHVLIEYGYSPKRYREWFKRGCARIGALRSQKTHAIPGALLFDDGQFQVKELRSDACREPAAALLEESLACVGGRHISHCLFDSGSSRFECFAVTKNSTIAAVVAFQSHKKLSFVELALFATRAEYRGKGLGKLLIQTLSKQWLSQGLVYCFTFADLSAVDFFAKCGFSQSLPVPRKLYETWIDTYTEAKLMTLPLIPLQPGFECKEVASRDIMVLLGIANEPGAEPLWRKAKVVAEDSTGKFVRVEYGYAPRWYTEWLHRDSPRLFVKTVKSPVVARAKAKPEPATHAPPPHAHSLLPPIPAEELASCRTFQIDHSDLVVSSLAVEFLSDSYSNFFSKINFSFTHDEVWTTSTASGVLVSALALRYHPSLGFAELRYMATRYDCRRQGFGSRILRAVISNLIDRECMYMFADHPLSDFLSSAGFTKTSPVPKIMFSEVQSFMASCYMRIAPIPAEECACSEDVHVLLGSRDGKELWRSGKIVAKADGFVKVEYGYAPRWYSEWLPATSSRIKAL